jgi:hypothetical protein
VAFAATRRKTLASVPISQGVWARSSLIYAPV